MPYTTKGKNRMLDALAPDKISLHTAEPNAEGSNEISGGEYARQTPEWNGASGGAKDDKKELSFQIPGGKAVKFAGYWKEGELVAFDEVPEETFTNAGTYTLTDNDLDLNA